MASNTNDLETVAIIGASLGGLTLALALHKQGLGVEIYELRKPGYDFGGAIMLSPNGLRVLDKLGIYERIKMKGFIFDTFTFREDSSYEKTGSFPFGGDEYGYHAVRLYRKILIAELQDIAREDGIQIHYGNRFSHIVSDKNTSVTFALADGSLKTVGFLIGADGIHSKARRHLHPEVETQYTGSISVSYLMDKKYLRVPTHIQDGPVIGSLYGQHGAVVLAPQNPEGTDIFAGRLLKYESQGRSTWAALLKQKDELVQMLQADMDDWSDLAQSVLEQADSQQARESLNVWAFHVVPHMPTWYSDSGRIVIMGDAAHALPPTTGQGANQALEDGLTLAFVLSQSADVAPVLGLKRWQAYRQDRIDKVYEVNKKITGLGLAGDGAKNPPDMSWLYNADIADEIEKVLGDSE